MYPSLISHKKCVAAFPDVSMSRAIICARSTEDDTYVNDHQACQCDSGDPLFDTATDTVVGVVLFEWGKCGDCGAPAAFAEIASLRKYIAKNTV